MDNIKRRIIILLAFSLPLMPMKIFASDNSNAISGSLGIYLPQGGEDSYDAIKSGVGFTAGFEHFMDENISVTARVGYIKWGTTEDNEYLSDIPLMAGINYFVNRTPTMNAYLSADLGLNMWSWMERGEQSYSHQDLGFGFGAGLEFPISSNMNFDLSGKYRIISWPSEWCEESFKNIEIGVGIKYILK